ncbi:DNA polymerase ligase N-terminal domain-containing protein [Bradyrhizobium brasilense]|uniref:DNA polymerase ligase N-terminal domain-containing protein n=1 Tax=Bradyrhizobium brasilense TaxID=1419277 RepID=UPI0024B14E39|nr:DNA polymerase ligase N-terminal domain-containing protein [Bradyrhizobium australafricanum]WFU34377.1 DNA polymerase ligase N-terminal domain-containing protein [Bradyrhizobium australafricanum]
MCNEAKSPNTVGGTLNRPKGQQVSLASYRGKRAFTETPEPVGRVRRRDRTRAFVVQKHAASRLHYDFRLAVNGVLASWAVPKGPSMNPADKRLAVRTEDHPLEYAKFEGVIPSGQYGAGIVMVWDLGKYEPAENQPPEEQLARGKVQIVLQGEKLRGGFTLIQTKNRSMNSGRRDYWLLIKSRDEYADPSWDIESARFDRSVLTARSMKEIRERKPAKSRPGRHRV